MAAFVNQGAVPKAAGKTTAPSSPGDASGRKKSAGKHRHIDVENLELSFCGCGFLGIYHVGVAAAFQTFLPGCKFTNLSGASAGAIAATGLIANVPVAQMASTLMDTCEKARTYFGGPFNPTYQVSDVLATALRRMLPEDIAERANGKLNISVTKVSDGKNSVINNFADKDELIKIIVASAFIPIFSGHIPEKVRGQRVIDGGFSVNLVKHSESTITVSPLAGDADICPLDQSKTRGYDIARVMLSQQGHDLTLKNFDRLRSVLYPPSSETLSNMLMQGFRDAHRFLRKMGLVSCSQCMTVRSTLHQDSSSSSGGSAHAHVHSEKCQDGLACEKFSESNLSMPSTLSTIVDYFVRSVKPKGNDVEGGGAGNYQPEEITPADAENMASSLVWRVAGKLFWYLPPVWIMRKSFCIAEAIMRAAMDVASSAFKMIPIERLLASESLTESFEVSLSKMLYQVSKYMSLGHYFQRIESTKERINCEVSISQFGGGGEEGEDEGNVRVQSSWHREDQTDGSMRKRDNSITGEPISESEDDDPDEQNVLEIEVNAVSEHRRSSKPRNSLEARLLQSENLLLASSQSRATSRVASRVASRVVSRAASRHSSRQPSRAESRRNSFSSSTGAGASGGSETLDNIRKVTESTESCLGYYYKNDAGDIVVINMYDITDTDPADLLGTDVIVDEEQDQAELDTDLVESLLRRKEDVEQQQGPTRYGSSGSRVESSSTEVDPRDVEDRLNKIMSREE